MSGIVVYSYVWASSSDEPFAEWSKLVMAIPPLRELDAANVQQQLHFEGSCIQPWFGWFWISIRLIKSISDLCIPHFNLPNSVFTGEASHPHLVFHFDIAHIKLQRSFKIYASTWSWRASTNSTSPAKKQARLQHCIYHISLGEKLKFQMIRS